MKYLRALLAALALSTAAHSADIQVFAAASLTDVLTELAPAYEARSGDKLIFNFASSNALARQITEGAPADVFFSADEEKMNALEKSGALLNKTRRSLLSNSLVIVTASDSTLSIDSGKSLDQPSIKRIALADTRAVPAGIYAKAYLDKIGIWSAIEQKVVPTENVRAALAAVEAGEASVGIVYKTDAPISKKVRVAYEVPTAETPKISYPVAVLKESKNLQSAGKFVEFLASEPALSAFKKYGFIIAG